MTSVSFLSRRRFTSSMTCAALAFAAPGLHAQPRLEKSKITVSVDGKASFAYLPMTIAQQLGYFKAEGLDVQVTDFSDAASATQALLSGGADVCSGFYARTLHLQSKNQMVRAFVLQSLTPQMAFGVSTRSLSNTASMADLGGKTIGVVALDSAASLMTQLLLVKAGLNVQDVNLLPVGSSGIALNAIRSGQIDALCSADPVMTMLEQKGDVKIISDTRTLRGASELFGGSMPSACLYANNEFVLRHPGICQAMTHAIVHSLKWLQTADPGDIIKVVPESYFQGDRAVYLASFNKIRQCISLDGVLPEDGPKTALKALSRFDAGLQQARIDVSKTYTNVFAVRSKERFKA